MNWKREVIIALLLISALMVLEMTADILGSLP